MLCEQKSLVFQQLGHGCGWKWLYACVQRFSPCMLRVIWRPFEHWAKSSEGSTVVNGRERRLPRQTNWNILVKTIEGAGITNSGPLGTEFLLELAKSVLLDGLAYLAHKCHKIMDVMDRKQPVSKQLLCHKEVTQVSP